MLWLVLVLVGALVGALLGLVGAGGGIVAVPALMLLGGFTAAEASALSLAAVLAGALVALVGRRGGGAEQAVDWRSVGGFLLAGIPASIWGARTAPLLPSTVLAWLLLAVLVVALWRQLASARTRATSGRLAAGSTGAAASGGIAGSGAACSDRDCGDRAGNDDGADVTFPVSCWVNRLIVGGVVGYLTGLLGVGGGFLIVPALTVLLGLGMRKAASTSLAIITGTSLAGVATHLLGSSAGGAPALVLGPGYPVQPVVLAGTTAIVALVLGRMSRRVSETVSRRLFLAALSLAILALLVSLLIPG